MKRALLIGICEYQVFKDDPAPTPTQWPRLQGPVNDVDNFVSLVQDLGFNEITILKNEQATKTAILAELEKIVTITKVPIILNFMFE